MSAVQVAERLTAEQFLDLPISEDGRPRSLVDGEVVVTQATILHAKTVLNILLAIENWARAEPGRGAATVPVDVLIDERNVYAPDVLWYAEGRFPDTDDAPPYTVPDLAVEVRSPSTWRFDIGAKKAGYERRGLPELWLVDTMADAVLVFRRSRTDAPSFDVAAELDRDARLESPLLPGFSLALSEVFPER